jgi:hypothetical protein
MAAANLTEQKPTLIKQSVTSSRSLDPSNALLQHATSPSTKSGLDRVTMENPQPTVVADTTSSIRVEHRDDRSFLDAATQTLLKPFASLILKPPKTTHSGSPRLTPHKAAEKKCLIEEISVNETWIYTLLPLDSGGEVGRPTQIVLLCRWRISRPSQ